MATARHGRVAFDKSGDTVRPVVTDLKKYADCDPPRDRLPEGSSPYTILQILIDGELCTFAASSWGARKSFNKSWTSTGSCIRASSRSSPWGHNRVAT